jgi:hypothetical protein
VKLGEFEMENPNQKQQEAGTLLLDPHLQLARQLCNSLLQEAGGSARAGWSSLASPRGLAVG